MSNRPRLTTDFASEADIQDILDLNTLVFGEKDILAHPADFYWQYADNPAGQAWIPVIRNHKAKVIGFIWAVPINFQIDGQSCRAASGRYLVIHPDYQRTMAYVRLTRQFERVFQTNDLPFHYSFVNKQVYQSVKEKNSPHAWQLPVLIKPLQLPFLNNSSVSLSEMLAYTSTDGLNISAISNFDSRLDDFWLTVKDKYPVMIQRNQAFLNWRFKSVANRGYKIFCAYYEDKLCGYIVLRGKRIRNIKVGLVLDFLVAPSNLGQAAGRQLLATAQCYFRAQKQTVMAGIMPPFSDEYCLLRQTGCFHWPGVLSGHQFRFAYFNHTSNSLFNLNLLSDSNWFITLADYEAH